MTATLADVLNIKDEPGRIHTASQHESVVDAVERMAELNIGSLLVLDDNGDAQGIFTERDVLVRVVAAGRNPESTAVEAVMTSPITTVPLTMTVNAALKLCTNERFRHLPVANADGPIGMLTLGDLTRWLVQRQRLEITELNDYIWGPRRA